MAPKHLSDRRMARRFRLAVPLYISEWKGPDAETKVESLNISETGVFFESDAPPCEGAMIRLRLEVPKEITGGATVKWRCAGKVVRVEPAEPARAQVGIGVRFDYYEVA